MDKEVSLTIKVNTNGEDKIHNVKASASELAQTIKDVEDAHESLNKQVQAEVMLTTEEIKRRYREAMEKRGKAGSVEIPKEDEQGDDAHHR